MCDRPEGVSVVSFGNGHTYSKAEGQDEDKGTGVQRDSVVLTDVALPADCSVSRGLAYVEPLTSSNERRDKVLNCLGTGAKHVLGMSPATGWRRRLTMTTRIQTFQSVKHCLQASQCPVLPDAP